MMHVPTAEMAPAGTARVGAFFLNGEFTPDKLAYKGEKYNTYNHFLAIAPFSWVELSYVCTLLKNAKIRMERRKWDIIIRIVFLYQTSSIEGGKILAGTGCRSAGSYPDGGR